MGSSPMAIGQAPPQPPDITGQMGGGGQGPGAMGQIASQQQGSPTANPHGAIFASANAVQAVLEQMAGDEPVFAPFARQAISAITNGVTAVGSAPAAALPPELAGAPPGIPSGPQGPPLG